jgi:hypothetical protein
MLTSIFLQAFCHSLNFINISSNTPPGIMFESWVAFTVDPEVCIVLSFNEPVTSFVGVSPPWLNREWLIEIIVMSGLLV